MTRYLLIALTFVFFFSVAFGDDTKVIAEAKAATAIAIAKAKAKEREKKSTTPKPMTLEEVKAKAVKDKKPLILWIGKEPPKEVQELNAIHFKVDSFKEGPNAKCVIFDCSKNECKQKTSIEIYPDVSFLRRLLNESSSHAEEEGEETFFVSTLMEPEKDVKKEEPKTVKVTRFTRVCDSNGVCRIVPVEETITLATSTTDALVRFAGEGSCPCVEQNGSCSCSVSSRKRLFNGTFRSWWSSRPRLFSFFNR